MQYATKRMHVRGTELVTVNQGYGTPILLVHGFPFDHTMWDEQIGALSSRYRVVAPDLRGFGQSNVTEGEVTMEAFADDMDALVDALGIDDYSAARRLSIQYVV